MRALVPSVVIARAAAGVAATREPGAVLFVDVRGFVALTRALAAEGPLGVEILAETITALFEPSVAAVAAHGGFIASYAGDAFTAVFLGPPDEAAARARESADAVITAVRAVTPRRTALGTFDLAVRVGVGIGEVRGHVFSRGDRSTYAFGGSAIDRAVEAQAAAAPFAFEERGAATERLSSVAPVEVPAPADARSVACRFFSPTLLDEARFGELRDVVVMFVALAGESLDDAVGDVLSVCARYAGHLRQIELGDKGPVALVYWGAPRASERDPELALSAALALTSRRPELRAALARGRVFAGFVGARSREEYACYGDAVNLAARMLAATPPGQISIDPELERLGRASHAFEPLGKRQFKGFASEVPIHRLVGAHAATSASGPLLGRARERAALLDGLRRALAGDGGAILVEGEAGVGKSRLVADARDTLRDETTWHAAAVDPIDARALGPVRAIVGAIVGATRLDAPEVVRAKLRATLDACAERGGALDAHAPLLDALLDASASDSPFFRMPPPARLAAQERAAIALFSALSRARPLVLQLDDLHLADPETRGFFERARAALGGCRVALLATARPLDRPLVDVDLGVTLGALSLEDVRALGESLVGRALSPEVAAWLAARTDGNPLFVEHTVLLLRDLDALDHPPDSAVVPPDLRAVLVARLDRLPPDVRAVVSDASALGREFDADELEALLVARGLTPPTATPRIGEAERRGVWSPVDAHRLMFAHALLRDAAYELSLASTRRELHGKVAVALRALYAGTLEAQAGRLAFHHAAAGELEPAISSYRTATERALRDGAHREAGAHVERALSLLPQLADAGARRAHELALRMHEGVVRIVTHGQGADETRRAYERADELSSGSDDPGPRFAALFGLRTFHLFRADHARSRQLAEACHALAATSNDPHMTIEADHVLGNSLFWAGELGRARAHLEAAIVGVREEMHAAHLARFAQTPRVTAMFPYATTLWLMGEADLALTAATGAHAFARELRQPFSEALVLQTLAYLHLHRDELELAEARAAELVRLAVGEGFPAYAPVGALVRGCAIARSGRVEEGLSTATEAAATMHARGVKVSTTLSSALIARAALDAGARDVAERALEQGLEAADATGERVFVAELLRLRGLARSDASLLARAAEVAAAQGAQAITKRLATPHRRGP